MIYAEDLEDSIDIDLVVFDLDGTIADTADLFQQDVRRRPYDVLKYSDHSSVSTPLQKIPGLRKICSDLIECGVRVAIITNSPRAYASTLCFLLGIDFDLLIAANSQSETNTKIQKLKWMSTKSALIEGESIDSSRILYVGDRLDDESAAHAAGCQFQWAPKGLNHLHPESILNEIAMFCSNAIEENVRFESLAETSELQASNANLIRNQNEKFAEFKGSQSSGLQILPNGPFVTSDIFGFGIDVAGSYIDPYYVPDILNELDPFTPIQRPLVNPKFITRYRYDHQLEYKNQLFKVLNNHIGSVRIGGRPIREDLADVEIHAHFKWSTNRIANELWRQVKNWKQLSSGDEVELLNLEFVALCMAASIHARQQPAVIIPMPSSSFSEAKPGRMSNRLAKRIAELLDFPFFEIFYKDNENDVRAYYDKLPFTSRVILIDDQITHGNLSQKCVKAMQELNIVDFEIRCWSSSRFFPMQTGFQDATSERERFADVAIADDAPRVGRRVHTQRHGIGVIKIVGEFYLEIDFKDFGTEFLSREGLNLEYLD
jgi:phosphoglycolate phosphatase-like HAD superfamily hydrolase